MKRLLAILALVGLAPALWAQIEQPVTWTFEATPSGPGLSKLTFRADIESGWHLYSQHIEPGGPIPTGFFFDEADAFTLEGKVLESGNLHEAYDETFEMELAYFDTRATFTQLVKLSGTEATVTGYLEFMVCDDEKCLPPEAVDFSIPVRIPRASTPEPLPDPEPAPERDPSPESAPQSETAVPPPGESAPATNRPFGSSLLSGNNESGQVLQPVSWTFGREALPAGQHALILSASVEPGWKIYAQDLEPGGPLPTEFTFEAGAYELIGAVEERGDRHEGYDDIFEMDVAYFEGSVDFVQTIEYSGEPQPITGELVFMACDDERCLPPEVVTFTIGADGTAVVPDTEAAASASELVSSLRLEQLDLDNPASDCIEAEVTGVSAWKDLLAGFLGGLFALLTPCVFPMIPLTVSFFTKGSQDRRRGITNAFLYGFSIFAIYALASAPFHLIEGIGGNVFNLIATDPWLNLGFFIIFVAFAISFFGYYEITLPSSLANKANSASGMGNLVGIFFMALTLCVVSFSCTGPILGSLVAVSASGSVSAWNLTAAMAGFGLALALPFGLFAAFPGWLNSLPKSGSWLNTVKVVLGFVELALAVKFLSNADLVEHWGILKRETFFLLWIMIGIAMIIYLLGKLKFPHDTPPEKISPGRWTMIGLTAAFVLYLVPGLTNSPAANRSLLSGFPPPLFYSWYEKASECPLDLPCYKDLEEGMAVAQAEGKPIMLDFTGWACVNCRRMEENVWVRPEIFDKLSEDYVLISLYVDDRKELPEAQQGKVQMSTGRERRLRTIGDKWAVFEEENFLQNTQPLYALISPEGELLNDPVGYTPNEAEYLRFLQCGLDAWQQKQATAAQP